jgi:hopanoid biosynthesis associated RND transporter like protein HpnN
MMRTRTFSMPLLQRWTEFIIRHPSLVLFLSTITTVGVLIYAVNHFRIDTELSEMISEKLPYRKLEKDFQKAFPQFKETILVVVDAETPESARLQAEKLAKRLKKESGLYRDVYMPGSGEFFERTGLLYLSVRDLEALSENLASAQPLLGLVSRDFTLRGLFSVVERMVSQEAELDQKTKLVPFFDHLAQAIEGATFSRPRQVSWYELILGKEMAREASRQFIIIDPAPDGTLTGGKAAIQAIDRIRDELGLHEANGIKVRLTGDVVLNYENLLIANKAMGLMTLASFILVALVLVVGLGSGRLVLASLMTLLFGFIWTLGFALFVVGRLNLISVAFGVLFIGLGIDYGIQYSIRYRELITSGLEHRGAVIETARGLGVGLRLCAVAAAIGFYSFLPTPYTGVSELGLIAGTGMLINLFFTLTLLPAFLTLFPLKKAGLRQFTLHRPLYSVPYRYARPIVVAAIVVAVGSLPFLPKLHFDYNPLNLYNPGSEAVLTIQELFKNEGTSPWTISILAKNRQEAEKMAQRLGGLKEVREAITLASFIPEDQPTKLGILSDIALFMPPGMGTWKPEKLTHEKYIASLKSLDAALEKALSASSKEGDDYGASVNRLHRSLEGFKNVLGHPEKVQEAFDKLEWSLLANLPVLFQQLETSLHARAVKESDLPDELRFRYVAPDGRYRVEVFPRENILKADSLRRFVGAVAAIAPNSTDAPVTIREAGNAVVRSFLLATLYALLAIVLYLLIELRRFRDALLALLPLGLSLLMMGAASVIFDLPFNFANVIVVPLLLGSGVEDVYLIYRFRKDPPPSGNMLETSTARALFLSTLTTILSFSALSFSPHRGMASMGKLLTIGIGSLMITTLVFLPALLKFIRNAARD